MSNCKPPGREMTPAQWVAISPCDKLAIVEMALMELSAGKTRAQVRHGENWVTYHPGSVTFLERERARLQALCNKRHGLTIGRTVTGAPLSVPLNRYRKF